MKALVVLISAVLLPAAAFAQPSSGTESDGGAATSSASTGGGEAGAQATDEAQPRPICRRIQPNTGTRMSHQRNVCMSAEQWRRFDRENR